MSSGKAHPPPAGLLATASSLFSLVPSCLMTLAPVTAPNYKALTQSDVEDVLSELGPRVMLVPAEECARLIASVHSVVNSHIEFAYASLIEDSIPFAITGEGFAFLSVIGFTDGAMAAQAGERMARHDRTATSCRGFVCANVIVQRLALDGMNTDKLDRFLLERFAAAATH